MAKRLVELFPDYCSTGLWLVHIDDEVGSQWGYHSNIEAETLGVSPALQIAVKYWHDVWEFSIAPQLCDDRDVKFLSDWYIDHWKLDGWKLAELLSAENAEYEFVYKE
jgi:hypothetical protein